MTARTYDENGAGSPAQGRRGAPRQTSGGPIGVLAGVAKRSPEVVVQ